MWFDVLLVRSVCHNEDVILSLLLDLGSSGLTQIYQNSEDSHDKNGQKRYVVQLIIFFSLIYFGLSTDDRDLGHITMKSKDFLQMLNQTEKKKKITVSCSLDLAFKF